MATRGRPPKPTELKRRLGNPGKRSLPAPLVVLPATVTVDQVPTFDDGRAFVQRMLDAGADRWVGATDAGAVTMALQLWDDRDRARREWQAAPGSVDLFRIYDDLNKRLMACLSTLGLDPVARARLGVAEVKVRTKLEDLAERRARAAAGSSRGGRQPS